MKVEKTECVDSPKSKSEIQGLSHKNRPLLWLEVSIFNNLGKSCFAHYKKKFFLKYLRALGDVSRFSQLSI